MINRSVCIKNRSGLHAKPASLFVQLSNKFNSEIYLTKGRTRVNAKSIMGVMILSVQQGDEIEIEASGEDEKMAIDALVELLDQNFNLDNEK